MSDYGVRRKFEVKNIEHFWAYESGVKFKHQNNLDEFDFPIETLKKMLEVYEATQQSVHPTRLPVREIEIICPNCNLVIDVPVPAPHSG